MSAKPAPPKGVKVGDEVYPPSHEGGYRTLVLLCDGTGDTDDKDISNVMELKNMILDDKVQQLVRYQPGIGTYSPHFPGFANTNIPFVTDASRTVDSALALSIDYHVVDCYEWVVDNYRDGDKICMFGFSRGSFTARSVAAMINDVGLLPSPSTKEQRWDAFKTFQKDGDALSAEAVAFRQKYNCRDVNIQFVGVWDTVCSVGVVPARSLAQVGNNDSVKTFRHAIALDEHRAKFKAHMWLRPSPTEQSKPRAATDVEEVWFAGAHCDVGGGSVPNETRPNLAHIPLRWMIRECFKTNTGIMFGTKQLKEKGLQPNSLYPVVVKPRPTALPLTKDLKVSTDNITKPGVISSATSWLTSWFKDPPPPPSKLKIPDYTSYNEEQLDLVDCLAPVYDQLEIKWAKWVLMEYLPLSSYKAPELGSDTSRDLNWSGGRSIPVPAKEELTNPAVQTSLGKVAIDKRWGKARIHRSVRTRMECPGNGKVPKYVPKALLGGVSLDKVDPSLIEWVD